MHLGFNPNSSEKLNELELLYRVNPYNHHIESIDTQHDNKHKNEDETAQVLSVQFHQGSNILACGDSDGRVQVNNCKLYNRIIFN